MEVTKKTAEDWKKVNLKKARFAHVTAETIYIGFETRVQGARVEYALEFPNDKILPIYRQQTPQREVRSYFVNENLVGMLKDIQEIQHYPQNVCDGPIKDMGVTNDTVILVTKKGSIHQSQISLNGKKLNSSDCEALYK